MITYSQEDRRFNLRAVAVIISRGRVLIHQAEQEDFWTLPGGRVELGESTPDSIRREMREELGLDLEVERLLWVAETFFEHGSLKWQELGFYFLLRLPAGAAIHDHDQPFFGDEVFEGQPIKLIFRWLPIAEAATLNLYPLFLRLGLRDLPPATRHIVEVE